jgi:hypothetical protein
MYTAAAAPPSAPPVSIESLRSQLTAEQERSASLQGQLDDLINLTGQLSGAVDTTKSQISTDGLTASQLRARLGAAQAKLGSVTALLKQAQARLAALQQALAAAGVKAPPLPAAPPVVRPPAGNPVSGMSLALSKVSGGVKVDWSSCSASGFRGYAVVRSIHSEIHFPPEGGDTQIGLITSRSTTSMIDTAPGSGTRYYVVHCLAVPGGDGGSVTRTATRAISVP